MLISKIKSSFHRLTHSGLGCRSFVVNNSMEDGNKDKFKFHNDCNNIQRFHGMIIHLNVSIRFYLNGDSKGLFQFLGVSGHDYHYCVHLQIGTRGNMTKCHRHDSVKTDELTPFNLWNM